MQYQSFELLMNNKELEFKNAGLGLSAFLWKNENEPVFLPEEVVPQVNWEDELHIDSFTLVLDDLLSFSSAKNPNIQIYSYKLRSLEIDQKLKFQELLPKVDLKYNSLAKGYDFSKKTKIPLKFYLRRISKAKFCLKIEKEKEQNHK